MSGVEIRRLSRRENIAQEVEASRLRSALPSRSCEIERSLGDSSCLVETPRSQICLREIGLPVTREDLDLSSRLQCLLDEAQALIGPPRVNVRSGEVHGHDLEHHREGGVLADLEPLLEDPRGALELALLEVDEAQCAVRDGKVVDLARTLGDPQGLASVLESFREPPDTALGETEPDTHRDGVERVE